MDSTLFKHFKLVITPKIYRLFSRFHVWIILDWEGLTTSLNLGSDELQAAEIKVLSLVKKEGMERNQVF